MLIQMTRTDQFRLSFSSFIHIFDISLVQQKLQMLDSVILNKVIIEDIIECAFSNVEISLRIYLTLMIPNCTLILSNKAHKKSKQNNDETREAGILISAHD